MSATAFFQQSIEARVAHTERELQQASVSLQSHLASCARAEIDRNRRLENLEKLVMKAVLAVCGASVLLLVNIVLTATKVLP